MHLKCVGAPLARWENVLKYNVMRFYSSFQTNSNLYAFASSLNPPFTNKLAKPIFTFHTDKCLLVKISSSNKNEIKFDISLFFTA